VAVRSHHEDEARWLESEGAARVFVGEEELAQAMLRHTMVTMQSIPRTSAPRGG
jgi:monovalent cation:H+ antiporter-2, CPA2 family